MYRPAPWLGAVALVLSSNAMLGVGTATARAAEETVWIEAEYLLNVQGYCFPDMGGNTCGNWGLSSPGTAPEWTQGGESE